MKRWVAFSLGIIALAVVVGVFASQRPSPARSTGTDTYSDDALGHEALPAVMRELGVHVLVDRRGVYRTADAPVFFIEPHLRALDVQNDQVRFGQALARRAAAGHDSVLVLPKWRPGSPRHGLVSRAYHSDVQEVLTAAVPLGSLELRREDTDVPQTAQLRRWTVPGRAGPRDVVLQERQTLRVHDDGIEVLLGTRRSALIVRYTPVPGDGAIFIVSDPDLLHNFNQHRGQHAQIVLDLLDTTESDTLVIDEVFHGHAFRETTAAVLGSTSSVIVVGHMIGLAIVFLWAGARRFPKPRHGSGAAASPSEALLDVAGQALAPPSGPPTPGLVGAYITLILTDAADRLGVAGAASLVVRAQALDDIASRRGVTGGAVALVTRARALPRTRSKLLEVARQAHDLRERFVNLKGTT